MGTKTRNFMFLAHNEWPFISFSASQHTLPALLFRNNLNLDVRNIDNIKIIGLILVLNESLSAPLLLYHVVF